MDVTDQLQEISILITEDRPVSALKKVPYLAVSLVKVTCISKQKGLHQSAERKLVHRQQQMGVIPHESIGINFDRVSSLVFGKIR
jgi:hypothetical protein